MKLIKKIYLDIKYGITNLIKWFPTIWSDRDWDYAFLMIILNKKLKSMSDLHYKHGHAEKSSRIALDLLVASNLANRIAKENYVNEAFKGREKLFDKSKMDFVPLNDGSGNSRLVFSGLSDEERKEKRELLLLADKLEERDINTLFNMMKNDLLEWWD